MEDNIRDHLIEIMCERIEELSYVISHNLSINLEYFSECKMKSIARKERDIARESARRRMKADLNANIKI